MQANRNQTKNMVLMGVFIAILFIQSSVPILGYIPLGFMNATIIHITVIIGAVILGPKAGGFLGLLFGLSSLIRNTLQPNPTSFIFSPFVTVGGYSGNIRSVFIALVPRIMIGVMAWLTYKAFQKRERLAILLAGVVGSMTNTIMVMASIYFLFGKEYAAARNMEMASLSGIIIGIIGSQGIVEAIAAAIITFAVVLALKKLD